MSAVWRTTLIALALVLVSAGIASAQFIGRATIKVDRVTDGNKVKIVCAGFLQVNLVEWNGSQRIIDFDQDCPLDDDFDTITFVGREQEGGFNSHRFLFTGVVGDDTDPSLTNAIRGGYAEELRFTGEGPTLRLTKSDGDFFFDYRNGSNQQVQVRGRIKAKCDENFGFCTP